MQAAKPSSKAAELLGETGKTLSLLEDFGPAFERRVLEALRPLLAEEVGRVVPKEAKFERDMMPGVYQEYHDPKNVVWVFASPPKTPAGEYFFVKFELDPKNAEADERAAKLAWRERNEIALPLESFMKLKEELKVAIMKGRQDQSLYLQAKELIYRRMGEVIGGDEGQTHASSVLDQGD